MKRLYLVLLFALLTASLRAQNYVVPPDVAATAISPDFPLHVHIFGVHWNRVNGGYEGYGRADLLGPPAQGIDYTFSCSEPFLHNMAKDEFYQARWKKQDMKLEILMQKVGSDKLHKCELKTSVRPLPYGKYGAVAPSSAAPAPPQ
jgi:hypothetical protein